MAESTVTWIWFVSGLILIGIEFFMPGLVIIFIGIASLSIAAMRYWGYVYDFQTTFTVWFVFSILYVILLRHLVSIFLPSTQKKAETDEEALVRGKTALVTKKIDHETMEGRIRYSGTEWPARALEEPIEPGSEISILKREGIGFLVQKKLDS